MSYSSFACYYDRLTRNVKYSELADYIVDILKRYDHKSGITLDLACGTGSLTIELAKRGFDIYGVDMSSEMLMEAQQKAYENDLNTLFLCQKMQDLDLYGTIDTCLCCLDSINHIVDTDILKKAFEKVSLFMNKGGYFIFDVNTPYKHKHILSDNTFVYDLPGLYCVWQNNLSGNDIINIDLDFFEKIGNKYIRSSEHFSERAYSAQFLSELLENCGFEIKGIFDDRTFSEMHNCSERLFFVAQKTN